MHKEVDILAELDMNNTQAVEIENTHSETLDDTSHILSIKEITEEIGENFEVETRGDILDVTPKYKKVFGTLKFLTQYSFTSLLIFGILMVGVNYQAYYQLLSAYINAEQMEENKHSMIESVSAAASVVREERGTGDNVDLSFITRSAEARELSLEERHSPTRLLAKASREDINLDIAITPYENRVVIPKIGKNIPLVEVGTRNVDSVNDLHDIFMEELERGIVRYPGSALPGEAGNSFIFGHSSNFPWLPGDYNEVFALLDRLNVGDEVIVYYDQKKYVYKIREKDVVKPGDTSVLRNQNKDEKLITLMTCWPVGTTRDRLLVIGELVEVK
ncbi:class E sortase [Candidatus Gracilibacteria bacterium]|nr:class E sortase [Candidatus Gracilibacteria bacterium]